LHKWSGKAGRAVLEAERSPNPDPESFRDGMRVSRQSSGLTRAGIDIGNLLSAKSRLFPITNYG